MQIKDFINATALTLADLFAISQSGNTRKITLQAIKDFLLGTTTLTTTDKTISGAIQELKGNIDSNTASLSDVAHKTGTVQTNLNADLLDGQHGSYYAPLASPNFTGTPQISSKNIGTCESASLTFLNGWINLSGATSKVSRNGNQVTLNISCQGGVLTASSNICILPSQFRPSVGLLVWGKYEDSGFISHDMLFFINGDGSITPTNILTSNTRLILSISFTL